jgi:hypothetical protein
MNKREQVFKENFEDDEWAVADTDPRAKAA